MDLSRLLAPRSIAVVGASTRPGSYGNQAVANLVAAGFAGPIHGVHPSATAVHGVACVPRLADLPGAPDVVIIATPAATVPGLIAEAGQIGCGGAVVFAAGFAEMATGAALQEELRVAAAAYGLPVCGPNGNGIVAVGPRAPMWGDSVTMRSSGPVALVSQSGNVAVNALGSRRGLRLHTVVSCGNQAVLDAADYLAAIAELDGVRSVALYLEAEGDGRRLARAMADCVERGIGIAVLKAGSSERGASAAAVHTGSIAGDARVLRALVEEAGGAWARNPHELLELSKAFGHGRRARAGTGVVIVTCSGGDAATGADEAARHGLALPALSDRTVAVLSEVLPSNAVATNPLDYTAVLFGEVEPTTRMIAAVGADEAVGAVLVYYDRPDDLGPDAAASWDGALTGIVNGAAGLDKPVIVASTLPELMPESTAEHLLDAGIVAVNGLTEGVLCAGALLTATGDVARLRAIADAAPLRTVADGAGAGVASGGWLAEHEGKALLRTAGIATPAGDCGADADAAVAIAAALGGPVAVKLSRPDLRHKSDIGALVLGVRGEAAVREAVATLRSLPGHEATPLLVEEMARPGVELMVAVRRDGAVPVLVLAFGGVWVEVLDDSVLIPLPVDPALVRERIGRLKGAPLLTGGRARTPVDLTALCRLASHVAALAVTENLELIELNPVVVRADGVTVVDTVIRRFGTA